MHLHQKSHIINTINSLASRGEAFVFMVDYKGESAYIFTDEELDEEFIRYSIGKNSVQRNLSGFQWEVFPVSQEEYAQKFSYVREQIQQGNSFLVNFTQPSTVVTDLSLESIYALSQARYKIWLKDKFVVLSPETFVRIDDGIISSYPMKGTIDAAIPNAEELILNDTKEKAEHATIVDLIRNDLSMVAEEVEVKRYRYIDRLQTNKGELLQISSEICGKLREDYEKSLGDILFALLPAGSISGAPKPKTLAIIEATEGYERGFYTGIFGKFDGRNLDSAVMIRFIEQQDNKLIFKSGGGITSQSDCTSEYNELIQKVYVPIY